MNKYNHLYFYDLRNDVNFLIFVKFLFFLRLQQLFPFSFRVFDFRALPAASLKRASQPVNNCPCPPTERGMVGGPGDVQIFYEIYFRDMKYTSNLHTPILPSFLALDPSPLSSLAGTHTKKLFQCFYRVYFTRCHFFLYFAAWFGGVFFFHISVFMLEGLLYSSTFVFIKPPLSYYTCTLRWFNALFAPLYPISPPPPHLSNPIDSFCSKTI